MKYQVRLDVYEGPLDLLLKLVERQEISVGLVSVSQVIEQFLSHFLGTGFTDLDEGSRFLVIAATLLSVKAQLILPRPQAEAEPEPGPVFSDEEDELDLELALREYLRYQEASSLLEKKAEERQLLHRRSAAVSVLAPEALPKVGRMDIKRLVDAFRQVWERKGEPEPYRVQAAELNLQEIMTGVENDVALHPDGVFFNDLFPEGCSRQEFLVTFLAVLELVYLGKVGIRQDSFEEDLWLVPVLQRGE